MAVCRSPAALPHSDYPPVLEADPVQCECHDHGMTVAAIPACPQCSHVRCDHCSLKQIKLPAHRAGVGDLPCSEPPSEWPFISQPPLLSALTEAGLAPICANDVAEFRAVIPVSSRDNESESSIRGRSDSPFSEIGIGTPATSMTSSSDSDSAFASEDGDEDDYTMERHIFGDYLWGTAPGLGNITDTFSPLVDLLFERYEQWRQRPTSAADNRAQSHSHNAGIRSSSMQPSVDAAWSSFVASRNGVHDESAPTEETEIVPPDPENFATLFACPFWKRDCISWRDCFRYKLRRIVDVRQHLMRIHAKYCYCDQCGQEFHTTLALNAHRSSITPCRLQAFQRRWLSQSQKEALRNRSRGTPENQWFAFWDIIFPRRSRPVSPYIDGALSEDLSSFLEFFLSGGHNTVQESGEPGGLVMGAESELLLLRLSLQRQYIRWAVATGHPTTMVQAIDDAMPPAQTPEWFSVDAGSQFEETIETEQEVEDLNQSLPRDDAQETDGFPGFEFVNFDGV